MMVSNIIKSRQLSSHCKHWDIHHYWYCTVDISLRVSCQHTMPRLSTTFTVGKPWIVSMRLRKVSMMIGFGASLLWNIVCKSWQMMRCAIITFNCLLSPRWVLITTIIVFEIYYWLVIRYFIRWRERYLHFTKESFNHNQSANKIVASDVLYASEQEREEQQELQVDDDDHFASDFKPKFSSNIHRNRAKFYFPFHFLIACNMCDRRNMTLTVSLL